MSLKLQKIMKNYKFNKKNVYFKVILGYVIVFTIFSNKNNKFNLKTLKYHIFKVIFHENHEWTKHLPLNSQFLRLWQVIWGYVIVFIIFPSYNISFRISLEVYTDIRHFNVSRAFYVQEISNAKNITACLWRLWRRAKQRRCAT